MTLINSMEQNISLPGFLDIRDAIHDKFGDFPIIGVSVNTYDWMKKLFGNEISFLETVEKTIFWGCELRRLDMRDGLFDFYVEV